MKRLSLLVVSALCVSNSVFAFDSNAFAIHLRKALALDTRADIKVSSPPAPSGVGDLMMVTATIGGAPYPVYMTKDEKKYIWGFVVDATTDPDKEKEKLISLKNVRAQGSPTAPITVVEYSDYQCSHCKAAHDVLKNNLYKQYSTTQVRFVYKHFPITGHDWAEQAAAAAECAGNQKDSTFWDMSDYFFDNQEKITKDNVRSKIDDAAKGLKLNLSAMNTCLNAGPAMAKVQADKKEGMAAGVNSTPTIFINGRSRRGFRDFDDIKVVIDEKLNAKK